MDKGLTPAKNPRENDRFGDISIMKVDGSYSQSFWQVSNEDMKTLMENGGIVELRIYTHTSIDGGHPVVSLRVPKFDEPVMKEYRKEKNNE